MASNQGLYENGTTGVSRTRLVITALIVLLLVAVVVLVTFRKSDSASTAQKRKQAWTGQASKLPDHSGKSTSLPKNAGQVATNNLSGKAGREAARSASAAAKSSLVNTGPGDVIALFLVVSIASAAVAQLYQVRQLN